MKLSEVKTEEDWEEYLYRKSIQTYEKLRIESGIGVDAYCLPDEFTDEELAERIGFDYIDDKE